MSHGNPISIRVAFSGLMAGFVLGGTPSSGIAQEISRQPRVSISGQSTLPPRSTNNGIPAESRRMPESRVSQKEMETSRNAGILADALRANPYIAPYAIRVSARGNTVILSGKVGTRPIYDMVIRTAIDLGVPFRDSLVIDTGEVARVAGGTPAIIEDFSRPMTGSAASYVYPPPLFGRVDEPFFGFEPPAVSFPPWWQPRSATTEHKGVVLPRQNIPGAANATATKQAQATDNNAAVKGKAVISVDEFGRILLQGVVASEQIKREIEAEAAAVAGVNGIINELTVEGETANQENPSPVPPPPQPQPPADSTKASHLHDDNPLSARVAKALKDQLGLKASTIRVTTKQGAVTLSGKVESNYQAMLAFGAARQGAGVRDIEVIDHMEFPLPGEDAPNPLLQQTASDDLLPYLDFHIRRNVGDAARIDRLDLTGSELTVHGSLREAEDKERVTALIRSIPLLKGFRVTSQFRVI